MRLLLIAVLERQIKKEEPGQEGVGEMDGALRMEADKDLIARNRDARPNQ